MAILIIGEKPNVGKAISTVVGADISARPEDSTMICFPHL